MDSPARQTATSADAVEFVRFCYRRRRVGWPELYDEMCAVASRGLFRGWGSDELADEGIGFSLFELADLASLVSRVQAEEQARRLVERAASREALHAAAINRETAGEEARDAKTELRLAGATTGA
jgi:hypothetical protein